MAKAPSNAGLVSLASTFTRTGGQPLDDTLVWDNLTAAQTYAKSERAYIGQILTVVSSGESKAYIIGTNSELVEIIGTQSVHVGQKVNLKYDDTLQALVFNFI